MGIQHHATILRNFPDVKMSLLTVIIKVLILKYLHKTLFFLYFCSYCIEHCLLLLIDQLFKSFQGPYLFRNLTLSIKG